MKYFIEILKILGYVPATLVTWAFASLVIFFLAFKLMAESFWKGKSFNFSKLTKL